MISIKVVLYIRHAVFYDMYQVSGLGYKAVILAVLGCMILFSAGVTAAEKDWTNASTKGTIRL